MTTMREEAQIALDAFKASKPVYRLSNAYYGGIAFNKEYRPQSERDDVITRLLLVRNGIQEHFNFDSMQHEIYRKHHEVCSIVGSEVIRYLIDLVKRHSDSKNNKLTALYR